MTSLGAILSIINFKTKVLVPFCLLPSLFLLSACSETAPSDEVSSETAISTEEENVKEAKAATLEKEAADKVAKEEADKLAAEQATAQQNAPAPAPATEVNYKNCTVVKDAGAAPLHAGQPGYGKHLDRDGDGVACEN